MLSRARAGASITHHGFTLALTRALSHDTAAVAGQPTYVTHPHLLSSARELTPGITRDEYAARRRALAVGMPRNSVAVLVAAPKLKFPGTIIPSGKYRPDADFAYATGVTQPECACVLERGDTADDVKYTLIVPEYDARYATWDGERINAKAATDVFGADVGLAKGEAAAGAVATALRNAKGGVYADVTKLAWDESHILQRAFASAELDGVTRGNVRGLTALTHVLRWRKSEAEIELIRQSVELDMKAFARAYATSGVGSSEAAVMAAHEAACRIGGADRLAYPSVVGSGAGACVVHYHPNDKILRDGDLLLMDAGCELNGYVSDITRTWPINGKWTSAQEDVYGAVLDAHDACVRAVRVDHETSLAHLHRLSVEVLAHGLAKLLKTSAQSLIRSGEYTKYYPHSVGHWLGMDTHDVPTVSIATPFENNVVFTIEPGLYFRHDDLDVPRDLRGIGIRIEDDCVVQSGACAVLSSALAVDPARALAQLASPSTI